MRIIALNEDPAVLRAIPTHLGRWQPKALEDAPPVPPGTFRGTRRRTPSDQNVPG